MLKISALALAGALSLAGCGRDGGVGPDDLFQGQFEGRIAGVLDGPLDGEALSGSTVLNLHDVILLTDYQQGIEVAVYHSASEFTEGRYPIGDISFNDVVAYVRLLDTNEYFDAVDGVLDLRDVDNGGIIGSVSFTAESDWTAGDFVDVDLAFYTDYAGRIDYNLSPSFSRGARPKR